MKTNKLVKIVFTIAVYSFIVIFFGFGIAGVFNKEIIERKVKEVTKTEIVEEKENTSSTANPSTTKTSSTPTSTTTPKASTPTGITMAQVSTHNTSSNCWIVISGVVYNISSYTHSGPQSHIFCGKDNTSALSSAHGLSYVSFFSQYRVGNLAK